MKTRYKTVLFPFLLLLVNHSAFAHPLDRRDLASDNLEGQILAVTPPPRFSVDQRLQKNVEFWIQINSKYDTRQGLVHDSKYIDHVYEVLDFRDSSKSYLRISKDAKRKWREILLS